MRVLVAMSGGVDSSVAAALMQAEGNEVVGVTLKLWRGPGGEMPTAGCCTLSDTEDARRVAAQLDIPYYVLDYTSDFQRGVIDRFIDDYRLGRTPNPCVECNRTVKFSRLLDQMIEFGCDLLVTGHYARVRSVDGRYSLLRGIDRKKDQSYVLAMLGQEALSKVRFPVGEMSKEETRRLAGSLALRTAAKADSQDICFVGTGDYRRFLRRHDPALMTAGAILDGERVVGRHEGVAGFTIGQRRGTGVALGERRYVVELRPESSTVVLGPRRRLEVSELCLEQITWTEDEIPAGSELEVQYRAHGQAVPATWDRDRVIFHDPQIAVAPGQTVAFYDGERVRGSGLILATA